MPARLDRDFSRTLAAIGGLAARSRLHALHPARPGDEGAATGFALALLGHLAALSARGQPARAQSTPRASRPLLWVQHRWAALEGGRPYGLGLSRLGYQPGQLILVGARNPLEALTAAEIGLEIGGLDGVLAELPPKLPADMLALGKRLALRAERAGVPCLLLHAAAAPVPSPVATRWRIASRPAVALSPWQSSLPAADLILEKNRFGPTGQWPVLLAPISSILSPGACDVPSARLQPPLPEPVAAVPADRPHSAPARPGSVYPGSVYPGSVYPGSVYPGSVYPTAA